MLTQKANSLFKENGLPVSVGAISISINGNIGLNRVEILAGTSDTIIYAGEIKISIKVFPLFSKNIIADEIFIKDVTASLSADSAGRLNLTEIFPATQEPSATNTKSGSPWEVSIDKVHIQNISFHYRDSSNGISIGQSLVKADLDFDTFSLLQKLIYAGTVRIEKASGFASVAPSLADTVQSAESPWKFSAREIELIDINYNYDNPVSRQKFSATLKKAGIGVKILDLASRELVVTGLKLDDPVVDYRPGLEEVMKNDSGNPEVTDGGEAPWSIACKMLGINNGNILLDTSFMKSGSGLAQWLPLREINTSVKDINFSSKGAGCNLEQLSLFMNNKLFLQSGKLTMDADSTMKGKAAFQLTAFTNTENHKPGKEADTVNISASLSGSMNRLNIDNFQIVAFSGAELAVTGFINDVMKIPESRCELKFHTNSISRNQIRSLISMFDPQLDLPAFSPFTISGDIANTFYSREFDIRIKSASGNIDLAGNYNLKHNSSKININFSDVKTAAMLGEQFPETITGKAIWNGRAAGINDIEGVGEIHIKNVVYNDIATQDLNLNLEAANNRSRFTVLAADSTLSCDLYGEISWDKLIYRGQLAGKFRINEDNAGLLPGNISVQSALAASFVYSGDTIESMLDMFDMHISDAENVIAVDSISWNLSMNKNQINSGLDSDFLVASFNSQSGYSEFADAIKKIGFEKLLRLDSANFINSSGIETLPVFDFTASAKYDSIFNLFLPDSVFSFNDVILKMGKSEQSHNVKMDLSADSIRYMNVQGFGTKVQALADENAVNCIVTIDSSKVNGVWGGLSQFRIDMLPDKITASIIVSDSTGLPVYRLGAEALKGKDRVIFRSDEPDWIINSGKWLFSSPEFLTWEIPTKDFLADLDIRHEQMQINLHGRKSDSLKLDLQNVQISQLISHKVISAVPDGILDAGIVYSDNNRKYADFKLNVKDLTWKGVVLDHLGADGYFMIDTSGAIESELTALINDSSGLKMKILPGDSISHSNISATFDQLPAKLIEPFAREYINKLDGVASGSLSMALDNEAPVFDGKIRLRAITLNVVPLQAWFTIPDDSIVIKSSRIYFERFMILDSLEKQLFVNGTLNLENPDDVTADLQVGLDDIRVMNTTLKDNPEFFGSIIVNSGLKITGQVTNPSIKGNIILQDGTNITYRQLNDLSVQETQKTVTFASLTGDSTQKSIPISRIREFAGMPAIQTTIDINPKSIFNIEISSGYDIHIGVSGSGLLNYTMLPNNTMSLTGSYEISRGTADLKFTGWPIKNFSITPGSSLRWDGDITDPAINLEATSKVEGSYVNPVDGKTRYVDFYVSMKLSDQLSKLNIAFNVKSPDQYITSVLNALSEDEQMRQAINLLIFESINLPNIESSSNYVDSQINSFWESQLNAITKTSFKKVDLSFGIDSYTQTSSGGVEEDKTSLSYEMERKFFRDRASVKISGRFNDDPQAGQQANTMVENFIFEYELDSLERNLLKLYTRKDYEDILDGEVTKSGVGYIYRKSYPDFRSIWRRKQKATSAAEPATPKNN